MKIQGESNKAYEFRSGFLIPGKIVKMKFIPEEGGRIIKLEDYKPNKDERFIYNLPGRCEYVVKEKK
jgi:hypothetical protein